MRLLVIVLVASVVLQAILITQVYGTLPLLSYLRQDGQLDIVRANEMQEGSGLGQIGLFDLSLSWLNGGLLLLLLAHYENGKKLNALAFCTILVVITGNLVNAKRQGLVRAIVYLVCGMALYSKSLSAAASRILPIPRNRLIMALAAVLLMGAIVYGFGYIAFIRNQGDFKRSGVDELIAYQEYPLLNFEAQCVDVGYGPYQFNFFYPLQRLVPYKLMQSISVTQLDRPVRVEPSSPSGFFEDLQWGMGPVGIIGMSLAIGMLARYFYSRALDSPPHLLIYCQVCYNLLVSHSFNQFLILAYFPGVFTVFLLCWPLKFRKRPQRPAYVLVRRVA